MSDQEMTRHDQVLLGLVFSLQAGAMQQLGKIQNPVTGEIDKDLEQARSTIDVLEMLKVKCRAGTPEDILQMMDSAVMNLQLNYMDEVKKDKTEAADGSGDAEEGAPDSSEESAERTDETGGVEADG